MSLVFLSSTFSSLPFPLPFPFFFIHPPIQIELPSNYGPTNEEAAKVGFGLLEGEEKEEEDNILTAATAGPTTSNTKLRQRVVGADGLVR